MEGGPPKGGSRSLLKGWDPFQIFIGSPGGICLKGLKFGRLFLRAKKWGKPPKPNPGPYKNPQAFPLRKKGGLSPLKVVVKGRRFWLLVGGDSAIEYALELSYKQ